MWRKEDGKAPESVDVPSGSMNSTTATKASSPSGAASPIPSSKPACLSQGIKIKGEITGSEDLFIDGRVEGKLTFGNAIVTVGPNAMVKADISAREVVVRGHVEGKLTGRERIQVWSTARINGELMSQRIGIEEGAELHGKLEAGKAPASVEQGSATPKKSEAARADSTKSSDAGPKDEKASSGAAVAGAD